jgi:hypothetical protein
MAEAAIPSSVEEEKAWLWRWSGEEQWLSVVKIALLDWIQVSSICQPLPFIIEPLKWKFTVLLSSLFISSPIHVLFINLARLHIDHDNILPRYWSSLLGPVAAVKECSNTIESCFLATFYTRHW